MRVGNKQNSYLNGFWAKHGQKDGKNLASRRRRAIDKDIIRREFSTKPTSQG